MRIALLLLACAATAPAQTPVIVELFTSEGCSSCPPADELLAKLEKVQPVSGARIIALSEHVDYWDRLGWRDPFSSPEFTARQNQYSSAFRQDGPYTPEAVIDGAVGFVGSNSRDVLAAVKDAAKQQKAEVKLTGSADHLSIDVNNIPGAKDADILLAITETGLQSSVASGENSGRLLKHTGVVRRLTVLGHAKTATFSSQTSVALQHGWKRENLQAIVFVQDRRTRRIVGAAVMQL
jgi:hypothetical protein